MGHRARHPIRRIVAPRKAGASLAASRARAAPPAPPREAKGLNHTAARWDPSSSFIRFRRIRRLRTTLTVVVSFARMKAFRILITITLTIFFVSIASATEISKATLEQHQKVCASSGADACVVIHRGEVKQEWYSPRYREPMMAMSSTKSVAGLLVGMLIADGKIRSIDQAVCDWISEWCDEPRKTVTLRHLLSMTSGLPRLREDGVGFIADKNPFVIALKPTKKPGAEWIYSNEGVQLLSPILDRAAREAIQSYAQRRLFQPLGMNNTRFHLDAKGHAWTYADMETTAREFARIGELILAKGKWDGKQVVPSAWVELSTKPSQELNPQYGLLWYTYDQGNVIMTRGHLETNLYIFREAGLVIARMQSEPVDGAKPYEPAARPIMKKMVLEALGGTVSNRD